MKLSEWLASLGIIGAQLKSPLKLLNTIILGWYKGFQGMSYIGPPGLPRDASFSDVRVTRGKTPRFQLNIFFLKKYQRFLNFVKFPFSPNSWGTFKKLFFTSENLVIPVYIHVKNRASCPARGGVLPQTRGKTPYFFFLNIYWDY